MNGIEHDSFESVQNEIRVKYFDQYGPLSEVIDGDGNALKEIRFGPEIANGCTTAPAKYYL